MSRPTTPVPGAVHDAALFVLSGGGPTELRITAALTIKRWLRRENIEPPPLTVDQQATRVLVLAATYGVARERVE